MSSSQPSTLESLKDSASSAANTVADTVKPTDPNYDPNKDKTNFTKDIHGNTMKKGDYKDQLSDAAMGGPAHQPSGMEKVMSYIPGVEKLLGGGERMEEEEGKNEGPPERPDHDVQVEQFLRKQYHSRSGDGMPDPDKKD